MPLRLRCVVNELHGLFGWEVLEISIGIAYTVEPLLADRPLLHVLDDTLEAGPVDVRM